MEMTERSISTCGIRVAVITINLVMDALIMLRILRNFRDYSWKWAGRCWELSLWQMLTLLIGKQ